MNLLIERLVDLELHCAQATEMQAEILDNIRPFEERPDYDEGKRKGRSNRNTDTCNKCKRGSAGGK